MTIFYQYSVLLLLVSLFSYLAYSATECDDEDECNNQHINDALVYCRGYDSCEYASITSSDRVWCTGADGCRSTDYITADSDIFCNGCYGCAHANSHIISIDGDIYCGGYYGCYSVDGQIGDRYGYDGTITVECTGDHGCASGSDKIEAANVYCDGYYGCESTEVSANTMYVRGEHGASDSSISVWGGKVYVYGSYGIKSSTVSCDTLYCYGYYGCTKAIITSEYIYVYGGRGAYDSSITARELWNYYYFYGYYAGAYSDIDSDQKGIVVNLRGFYSGYHLSITCQLSYDDRCKVNCLAKHGCYNTKIYYYRISDIELTPTDCINNAGSIVDGVYCPYLYDISSGNEEELKQQHNAEKISSKEYEELEQEIKNDEIQARKRELKSKNAQQIEENQMMNNQLLFGGLQQFNSNSSTIMRDMLCILIGSFLTAMILCCYFKNKYKDSKYDEL